MKNPYDTLGVKFNDSKDTIKAAYRKLASKHHPDKGGDPDEFKKIQDAYDTINKGTYQPEVKKTSNRYHVNITLEEAYEGGKIHTVVLGELTFPAGIRHGAKIIHDGDIVEFRIEQHEIYKRSADDLLLEVEISSLQALVGATLEFTHLSGKVYNMRIRCGIQNGEVIKMSNFGMPNPELDTMGDLFVTVTIKTSIGIEPELFDAIKRSYKYEDKIIIDKKV